MKYILMMAAPKAGFDTYRAWSKQDKSSHVAFVMGIKKSLSESGEFVAAEGFALRPACEGPVTRWHEGRLWSGNWRLRGRRPRRQEPD